MIEVGDIVRRVANRHCNTGTDWSINHKVVAIDGNYMRLEQDGSGSAVRPIKDFVVIQKGREMSSVRVTYKKESRPVEKVEWLGHSKAYINDVYSKHVFLKNMGDINGDRDPRDVIEFAEGLIALARTKLGELE